MRTCVGRTDAAIRRPPNNAPMRWVLYCRVVDNFGDVGFSWRLAAALASRGESVHLAIDDATALAWLAPDGHPGVTVGPHDDDGAGADVWVETFGSGLPARALAAAEVRRRLPLCVNVEHLTAEPFARATHGLMSPRHLPDGRAFPTWFFYPGFDEGTGGLLREPGAVADDAARAAAVRTLAGLGAEARDGERRVLLFGYAPAALDDVLDALSAAPTQLLLAPGALAHDVAARLGAGLARGALRATRLPFVPQPAFDELLRAADLAFVRGEETPVRALWSGTPFVWELYRQHDGAQHAKLAAFLQVHLRGADAALAGPLAEAFAAWNGTAGVRWPRTLLSDPSLAEAWRRHARTARTAALEAPELVTALVEFANARIVGFAHP